MVNRYIPKQKDIVFVDLSPTKGHEQSGKRPAIVISNNDFNNFTKMVILCPITSNAKVFPTHYILQETKKITGAVLCEHIKSIDYEVRNITFVEKSSEEDFKNVINLLYACIEEEN